MTHEIHTFKTIKTRVYSHYSKKSQRKKLQKETLQILNIKHSSEIKLEQQIKTKHKKKKSK